METGTTGHAGRCEGAWVLRLRGGQGGEGMELNEHGAFVLSGTAPRVGVPPILPLPPPSFFRNLRGSWFDRVANGDPSMDHELKMGLSLKPGVVADLGVCWSDMER
eukprot:3719104-Rhodomonas_salina.1